MKKIATALLGATLLSAPAGASDIFGSSAGSTKDAPVANSGGVVNWSGFYVGGQIGYGNANHDLHATTTENIPARESVCSASISESETIEGGIGEGDDRDHTVTAGVGVSVTNVTEDECNKLFGESGATVSFTDSQEAFTSVANQFIDGLNSHGFIGGGRVGFDWARGRLLGGVFAGYDLSNMETDSSFGKIEKQDEWMVGLRLGYIVAPRTMAYVLGAYTQTEYEFGGDETTFNGWTAGAGIEFALSGNVFLGMEYTHTFYDKETLVDVGNEFGSFKLTDDLDEDKIMATLKVKLNGGL